MSTVQTAPSVLVVDLDGTLLRSDMLYETFWSAVARDWRTLFTALAVLPRGRLALKTVLAGLAPVDETTLPYDQAVIDLVRSHREAGGRTALVSASEQGLVRRIADHLGLFDEAHGSQGGINLKGAEKRAFLVERYGDGGFVYAGDSRADLEVWKSAETIITVNAGAAVRAQAEPFPRQMRDGVCGDAPDRLSDQAGHSAHRRRTRSGRIRQRQAGHR